MKTNSRIPRFSLIAISLTSLFAVQVRLPAQVQVLDDFSSGNITVSNSTGSSFIHNSVPGVFGGTRDIFLNKADESSTTSIIVGSGALTWVGTAQGDEGFLNYGTPTTSVDLSAYNAFRITIDSAPQNPGKLEVDFSYLEHSGAFGVYALATLPTSGTVDIPFSSFIVPPKFPPLDFTQAHSVGLSFRGSLLAQGTYVLDNFQVVVVPEPSSIALLAFGMLGVGLACRFNKRNNII